MSDGVRLACLHLAPVGRGAAPAIVVRTPYGVQSRLSPTLWLGRIFAEHGYHVILQDVRGRYQSEGRFVPFADEGRDGQATLEWVVEQSWCDGRIGVFGVSYPGYAAWAALGASPGLVDALAVALGASDLYASFYVGGAFSLRVALEWGVGIGERTAVPRGALDLERALGHRPVREADRVAFRNTPWFRDWLDHPRRDDFWDALRPKLPERPPPTLLIAGSHDFFLAPQLADFHAVDEAAERAGTTPPRLVVGPWAHGRGAHRRWRARRSGLVGVTLRETLSFFDRELAGLRVEPAGDRLRMLVPGARHWRGLDRWPEATEHVLHLRSGGSARSLSGDGRLEDGLAPDDEPADALVADPEHPVPSCGGPLLGPAGGARDQREIERRPDVLCYTSALLSEDLELAGPGCAVLHITSTRPDSDFTAKLVDVAPNGPLLDVCDGIARARWRRAAEGDLEPVWLRPDEPQELTIELVTAGHRFLAGHRIRLEISWSNFPRFDLSPLSEEDPSLAKGEDGVTSRQTVLHDASHPSRLVLAVASALGP